MIFTLSPNSPLVTRDKMGQQDPSDMLRSYLAAYPPENSRTWLFGGNLMVTVFDDNDGLLFKLAFSEHIL